MTFSEKDLEAFDDDFVLVSDPFIPTRTKILNPSNAISPEIAISMHTIREKSATRLLVSLEPPAEPEEPIKHAPCDIVLVIDVSGSMHSAADLLDNQNTEKQEKSGLSILDLTKHAARTIIENLNEGDRLSIVTFSDDAQVIQPLVPMTDRQKDWTDILIENLTPQCSTNLWAGLREGLEVIDKTDDQGNIQGIFVLTDGQPNHMQPSQGYVKKISPILAKLRDSRGSAPVVHTFGFGNYLDSALLQSIAEVGHGNYAFIPDAGMIGTVFVHAVANLFSTFAIEAQLELTSSSSKTQFQAPRYLPLDVTGTLETPCLNLGNVQYGQSRDLVFTLANFDVKDKVTAKLTYLEPKSAEKRRTRVLTQPVSMASTLSRRLVDYHLNRDALCHFLSSLNTTRPNLQYIHKPASDIEALRQTYRDLILSLRDTISTHPAHEAVSLQSLLADLESSDPSNPHSGGQISLALFSTSTLPSIRASSPGGLPDKNSTNPSKTCVAAQHYYTKWGMHYLPSILHAHARQICNSFKDAGPLKYGENSSMFIECRRELDAAFDALPAPKPSLTSYGMGPDGVQMARYNFVGNPCFSGDSAVLMADGETRKAVEELRVGDHVFTLSGTSMVRGIVKTDTARNGGQILHKIVDDGLWITPYHPILVDIRESPLEPVRRIRDGWDWPMEYTLEEKLTHEPVYSLLLEENESDLAHILDIGEIFTTALGHGQTDERLVEDDCRNHKFFGDYNAVLNSLEKLPKDECGRWISGGVARGEDGLVNGFVAVD